MFSYMLSSFPIHVAANHLCSTTVALLKEPSATQGDVEKIRKLLSTSTRVLANTVDENRRRSATLHVPGEGAQPVASTCAGFALV